MVIVSSSRRVAASLIVRCAILVTAIGFVQGCGSDVSDTADAGTGGGGADAATGCPGVPCEGDEVCVGGECLPPGSACVDGDGDGFGPFCDAGDDCDDDNAEVHPGRAEVCNDIDDDCDFFVDEENVCAPCNPSCTPGEVLCNGSEIIFCDDSSGCPRLGDPVPCPAGEACRDGACVEVCVDADNDGYAVDCPTQDREDCDDARSDVYPGAEERCDGLDNNCDTRTDENFVCGIECEDECTGGTSVCTPGGGGRIDCIVGPDGCARQTGVIPCTGGSCVAGACVDEPVCVDLDGDGAGPGCGSDDCRPLDPTVAPGRTETCDGRDQNCNGVVDDGGVCGTCAAPTQDAPGALAVGDTVYVASCGGFAWWRMTAAPNASLVVLASSPTETPSLEVGRLVGGEFVPAGASYALGSGRAAEFSFADADIVRVRAAAGAPLSVTLQRADAACEADAFADGSPVGPAPAGDAPFATAATVCAADFDFVSVTTRPGDIVSMSLAYDPDAGANLVGTIWRNGTEITTSFGGGDGGVPRGRMAWFRADLPGEYVVGVRGFTPSAVGRYALAIETLDGGACSDDARETADGLDDDTLATARTGARPSQSVDGVLCAGDIDIISLGEIREGATLDGSFTAQGGADIDAWLLYEGWSARRDFPSAISATGDYYIAVFGGTPQASGRYSLSYTVR